MMAITAAPSAAFANQPEQVVPHLGTARKQQYVLSTSADNNALQINGSNITLNGNMYTSTNMNPYFGQVDVRGKAEFGGELLGREYANFTSYIYKDHAPKRELIDFSDTVMDSLGESPVIHEWWQTYSGTDVTNDGPIHAKSGLQFSGSNVELNGTIVSDSYMMVSASRAFTTPVDGEVNLYVPNGNIGIYGGDIDIDAVIYAPNGTVQISGSNIQIDGVIIAKEIQISGQDIVLNQNLNLTLAPFIQYYNEALWLMAECAYNTETELFTLDWESRFEEGTFDIYTSANDMNYTLKGTVQDTDTYAFSIDNPMDNLYVKIVQTLDNGVFKESNVVRMAYDEESGYVMAIDDDTDGDGLTDIYEHFLETDKRNPDTDGDGLSDGEEVYLTDTDPLYRDSDEDTIPDGDEDPDFDGLTNLQEIQYGTKPQNPDTDTDDLSDYDEIFVYGTDPLKPDTDGDGINDGDEIALGLNPLLPDSDGDGVPDGQEKIYQTFTHEVENGDCAVEEVSVAFSGTGYINTTTTIQSIMNIDMLSSEVVGLVGEPFEIESESEFDTAVITFKVDRTKLGDTAFDDLMFLWHDEENHRYVELETMHDEVNGTVSVETTHFSKYMIIDKNRWYEAWTREINYHGDSHAVIYCDIVFAIDVSPSMDDVDKVEIDPNSGIHYSERHFAVKNFIKDMNANDRLALVEFGGYSNILCGLTDDKTLLNSSLGNLRPIGSTNFINALETSESILQAASRPSNGAHRKIIVLLSDGEPQSVPSDALLLRLKNEGIIVYTIGIGNNSGDNLLQHISDSTKGEFFKADRAYQFREFYSRVGVLKDIDDKDTDKDGLYDVFEIAGMRLENGKVIYSNPLLAHSDSDGLKDGEEINLKYKFMSGSGIPSDILYGTAGIYFVMNSDPNLEDSDGDGISDYDETIGVSYNNPNGTVDEYEGDPLNKGLANGIVGKLTIVSHDPNGMGHSFLLYESYINDTLDLSGLAAGFEYIKDDGDDNNENNWKKIEPSTYKISPNRYISIGNFVDGGIGSAPSSGVASGSSGNSSSGNSQSGSSGSVEGASAGIHYNMELNLLYDDNDGDGYLDRKYGENYALDHGITEKQLKKAIKYWNSDQHYNVITNNCAEIAAKTWEKAFGIKLGGRMWLGVFTPNPLKKSISKQQGAYVIDFRSDIWKEAFNQEVVIW